MVQNGIVAGKLFKRQRKLLTRPERIRLRKPSILDRRWQLELFLVVVACCGSSSRRRAVGVILGHGRRRLVSVLDRSVNFLLRRYGTLVYHVFTFKALVVC